MSDVVRIQSTKNIVVTSGLQYDDVTNPDAHVPDRLKVSALWPKSSIMISEGVGIYPAEIAEWPTVKALVENGTFSLMAAPDGEAKKEDIEKVEELKEEKVKKSRGKSKKLEDAIEEE